MAIQVLTLNKPWIWLQATTGGSLTAGTYYVIGYFAYIINNGPYYGYAPGVASDEFSVTTDATNNRIKMEIYEQGGYISGYADTGDATHVTVTTTVAHGKSNGDTVYVRGSTNYTGKYTISGVTATTFDIVATWVADDGASNWYATPGMPDIPTNYPGFVNFYFKWDNYSMLRGDGSKFQWLNTNDSTYSNEWYTSNTTYNAYGHRRWGGVYYWVGIRELNLTTDADGSQYIYKSVVVQTSITPNPSWTTANLYEGTSDSPICSLMAHPEIAMRKYDNAAGTNPAFQLPSGMSETESAVLIFMDNTDSNNGWDKALTAIYNSGMVGKSIIMNPDASGSPLYYYHNGMMFRGILVQQRTNFTAQPIWYGKTITCIHGNIRMNVSTYTNYFLFHGCQLYNTQLNNAYWYQPSYCATNTRNDSTSTSAFILDDISTVDNFTPFGYAVDLTDYTSKANYNFIGKGYTTTNAIQLIRYPVDGATVTNCKLYKLVAYVTPYGAGPRTYTWTDSAFYKIQSDAATSAGAYNMDFLHGDLFTGGTTVITHTWNMINVTSGERSNQLCRVKFTNVNTPGFSSSSQIIYNFFFSLNLNITDTAGNPIEGATVSIENSNATPDTYSTITNTNGDITEQNIKCYTVEFDINNADGYWYSTSNNKFYSKTTLFNNVIITISKTGYETITVPFTMLEKKGLNISLTPPEYIYVDKITEVQQLQVSLIDENVESVIESESIEQSIENDIITSSYTNENITNIIGNETLEATIINDDIL